MSKDIEQSLPTGKPKSQHRRWTRLPGQPEGQECLALPGPRKPGLLGVKAAPGDGNSGLSSPGGQVIRYGPKGHPAGNVALTIRPPKMNDGGPGKGQLPTMGKDIEQSLRDSINQSGLSHYRLWKDTGVDNRSIGRFVDGERTLRLDIAAKLAKRLGLELKPKKGR